MSIVHYALMRESRLVSNDEYHFELGFADALPDLPFDHNRITNYTVKRLRDKSAYSSLPAHFIACVIHTDRIAANL